MRPRGAPLTQARVAALAAGPGAIIVCGRFEGVDERVIAARGLEEVSLGDYVLSGGEIAALALIDACVRLLPGVMGKEASGAEESFSDGLLEYPQYTRPQVFEGRPIPEVLTVRRPRQGRGLAARRGGTAHPGAPAGPVGGAIQAGREPKGRDERVTSPNLSRRTRPTRSTPTARAPRARRRRRRIPMNLFNSSSKSRSRSSPPARKSRISRRAIP